MEQALVDGIPRHPELAGDLVRLQPAQVAELADAPLALGQLREPLRELVLVLDLAELALVAGELEVVGERDVRRQAWKCALIVQSTTLCTTTRYGTRYRLPA